jgi:hypothetical protein
LVQRAALNELVVLDHQLTPIWRLRLPAGRLGVVAVADDLSLVVVSRGGQVVFLDGTGRQLASVPGAGLQSSAGVFTADGAYLWVVSPGRGSEAPVTASQELWLIDVATFSIVDRRRIGMFVDGCQPIRCPDGHTVGLSLWVEGRPAIGWGSRRVRPHRSSPFSVARSRPDRRASGRIGIPDRLAGAVVCAWQGR